MFRGFFKNEWQLLSYHMEVSEITHQDIEELKDLQPEGWPDIIPHVNFYISSSFCIPVKLLINKRIVGMGAAVFHSDSAWLGHIIVHTEFRNRGIGTYITQFLISAVNKKKYSTISLIATEMGEPIYQKLGFRKITEYCFFRSENLFPALSDTKQIKNGTKIPFHKILELDRVVSGENRSLLLECYLPTSKVFLNGNEVVACFLPDLGEGLIIAKDKHAGVELLKLRLSAKNFCILPQENDIAIEHLISCNFRLVRKAARMSIGKAPNFKAGMLFSRIGGNLG